MAKRTRLSQYGERPKKAPPTPIGPGSGRQPPSAIARDFRRLARRFQLQAKQARKALHLAINLEATAAQAGLLLVVAIDAGAFPETAREINGDWWDRSQGRVPGDSLAVLGSAGSDTSLYRTYRAAAIAPFDARQARSCWSFSVGSWLARAFPHRFRSNAGAYDSSHVATDAQGRPLGKDRKPLRYRWYKDGKPLPRRFKWTGSQEGQFEGRIDGGILRCEELYDEADWLAHLRARAEIYSDAWLVLAELISPGPADESVPDTLVTLSQVAPLTGLCKRTLERYRQNRDIPDPDIAGGIGKANM